MPTRQKRSVSMPKNLKLKAARAEKDMTQGALAEAHTHTQLTKNRKGTTKCLFLFFKKIGGEKHLG